MFRAIIICIGCLLLMSNAYAKVDRVIYITLDGVRWQDVFLDHAMFPRLWQKYAKYAEIYGAPNSNRTIEVASIPVSLASYQSQMSGKVQLLPCGNNECGRITLETFPEVLVNKVGLHKRDVATIASWELTDFAVESVAGTTYTNCGVHPIYDPITFKPDTFMAAINKQQTTDFVRYDTRLDQHTQELALHYYKKYQPRFLWLSFGNADIYAHDNNLRAYQASLRFYDKAIDEFMELLQQLDLEENTLVIITTDHGRGNGENWTSHNEYLPESKQTWAFVLNGKLLGAVVDKDIEHYSTLSIRPTIEAVFQNELPATG